MQNLIESIPFHDISLKVKENNPMFFVVSSRIIRETAEQEEGTQPCDPCACDRIPQPSREGYQDGAVQKQKQILSVVPVHLASCQSLPVETEVWLLDLLLGRRS